MIRPVTVFVDGHTFDVGWQGTTTYLAGILNALPDSISRRAPGVALRLVCAAEHEENIRRHVSAPFEFVPIRTGLFWRNGVDIPRILKQVGADLAISQYIRPIHAICPTLSVIHDVLFLDHPQNFSWPYRLSRRALFGWSARHSSMISTVSHYSAERIQAWFGVPQERISIIPNGVDASFTNVLRPPRPPGDPLRLLSVSRLERRKRHEWGIAAQEVLSQAGIGSEYVIVGAGSGTYARKLRTEVRRASQRGYKVDVRSGLPLQDVLNVYSDSDLFLLPTEAEGFGIPVLEGAAAGLPGVVSDGGALSELKGVFVGEMFPADSREGFLDAVLHVARNIETLRAEAAARRSWVASTYSWLRAADAYSDIILSIATSKARLSQN